MNYLPKSCPPGSFCLVLARRENISPLSHMNCNYTPKHKWNPSSSGREMVAKSGVLSAVRATSSCELIASFIYQTAPASAMLAAASSHCDTHSNSNHLLQDHSKPTTGVLQLSCVLQSRSSCPDTGRSPTDFQVHALLVVWYGYYLSKRT